MLLDRVCEQRFGAVTVADGQLVNVPVGSAAHGDHVR
jgi:hypothetical protein